MEKDKNYIVRFFESLNDGSYEDIEVNKIEENSHCIYIEIYTTELEFYSTEKTLTIANWYTEKVLRIEDYDVNIFYDKDNLNNFRLAFWKKK